MQFLKASIKYYMYASCDAVNYLMYTKSDLSITKYLLRQMAHLRTKLSLFTSGPSVKSHFPA